ncbi:MAG: biotin--[acetyl-CoA-carboxylase] ligase [Candidatus Omnitrophica bacterium]|nr:biotin--[acetyl-CoA-carboxylase] ligase [Candidatus Omnitrophota bacterium]
MPIDAEELVLLDVLKTVEAPQTLEALAQRTGLAPGTVGRLLQQLQAEGYRLTHSPNGAWRLVGVPDRLTEPELTWRLGTRLIGSQVLAFQEVDSTMDLAHEWAKQGAGEGTVIVADAQRSGRGRFGRVWTSPPGTGIYCSILLRPQRDPEELSGLTLLGAVAVAEAVHLTTHLTPAIRWPNDLLIEDRKIAGILTETQRQAQEPPHIVMGIGINVNTPAALLPPEAGSLTEAAGLPVDRLALARALLQQLDRYYLAWLAGETASIHQAWRRHLTTLGHEVTIQQRDRTLTGTAVDVTETGALVLRGADGITQTIHAADTIQVR